MAVSYETRSLAAWTGRATCSCHHANRSLSQRLTSYLQPLLSVLLHRRLALPVSSAQTDAQFLQNLPMINLANSSLRTPSATRQLGGSFLGTVRRMSSRTISSLGMNVGPYSISMWRSNRSTKSLLISVATHSGSCIQRSVCSVGTPPLISETTIQQFLQLDYAQFIAVKDFLYPDAQFSTEHGVKGEEYDNVVFVISKGWNQYQFETYAPMITGHVAIPKDKEASYERNRNLFYVCCSRPKKRLFFFVTVPIDTAFRAFLITLVGKDNIITYRQFMEMAN